MSHIQYSRRHLFAASATMLVVALILAYYWLTQGPTLVDHVRKVDDVSDTATLLYTNAAYGYSFSYPSTFKLLSPESMSEAERVELGLESGDTILIEKHDPNENNITYVLSVLSSNKLNGSFDDYLSTLETTLTRNSVAYRKKERKIGPRGLRAIELSFEMRIPVAQQEHTARFYQTIVENERDYFSVSFSIPNEQDSSKYTQIYNDLLESFSVQ